MGDAAAGGGPTGGSAHAIIEERQVIVDALLGLYHRDRLDPTPQEIADQAGISVQAVEENFEDREALALAAVRRQHQQIVDLLEPPVTTGPQADRVTDLVTRRSELFEAITPVRRAALLLRHRSPTIDENLAALARLLRAQLTATFRPELGREARLGRANRALLLDALDVATSWETWERLRSSQALTRTRARSVVCRTLAALLADDDATPN